MSLLTSLIKQILFSDKSLGYPNLEEKYSKIISVGLDVMSLNQRMHLVVYTEQVSGRLTDKKISRVGVL